MVGKTSIESSSASNREPLIEEDGEENRGRWWMRGRVLEAKKQSWISMPMILTSLFYYLITLVSVMFAGHLGNLQLAAATLANSYATVTGFAFMVISFFLLYIYIFTIFKNTLFKKLREREN